MVIGAKMPLIDAYKIPVAYSLDFAAITLAVTMILSLETAPKGTTGSAYPSCSQRQQERAWEPLVMAGIEPRRLLRAGG